MIRGKNARYSLPFLGGNFLGGQADFPWPLDGDFLALLVRNNLADLPGFVSADLLGTSGAGFAGDSGALLGRERMALLLTLDSAVLLGQVLAVLLVDANLLVHIVTELFILGTALFPRNGLASLPGLVGANLVRHLAADFLGLVVADSLVVAAGNSKVLVLLGKLFLDLVRNLVLLGQLFLDLVGELLLEMTLGDSVFAQLAGSLVQLVGDLGANLVELVNDLIANLGVEVDEFLSEFGELATVLAVQLVVDFLELLYQFGIGLVELVGDLILDLDNLVFELRLEETDLVQQLVLQRLLLELGHLVRLTDVDRLVVDGARQRKWDVDLNLATDLLGGSGAFLGVFGAADTLVGHCALPVLQSGADLAWRSLALPLANGRTFRLVHAVLLPNQVAVRNRKHGALFSNLQTAAFFVPDGALALINGLTRPEGVGGALIAIHGLALLLPNVVVDGFASLQILVLLGLFVEELETGSRMSQYQPKGHNLENQLHLCNHTRVNLRTVFAD